MLSENLFSGFCHVKLNQNCMQIIFGKWFKRHFFKGTIFYFLAFPPGMKHYFITGNKHARDEGSTPSISDGCNDCFFTSIVRAANTQKNRWRMDRKGHKAAVWLLFLLCQLSSSEERHNGAVLTRMKVQKPFFSLTMPPSHYNVLTHRLAFCHTRSHRTWPCVNYSLTGRNQMQIAYTNRRKPSGC